MTEKEFNKLFKAKFGILRYIAFKLTDNEMYAKDIASEAFIELWNNRDKEYTKIPYPFLYRVVRNRAINYSKKMVKRIEIDDHSDEFADSLIIKSEFIILFRKQMETLTTKQKLVLELYYLNHLDMNSIVLISKMSIDSIRQIMMSIRKKFKIFPLRTYAIFYSNYTESGKVEKLTFTKKWLNRKK